MDTDSPWEEDLLVDYIPEAEKTQITSEFTNSGYREGIIAGKEAFLQAGFDAGFADVGVPLGRELGNLRGAATAMGCFLASQTSHSQELEELLSISRLLSAIRFSGIAPRDLDSERHAKEPLDLDDFAVVENTLLETGTVPPESQTMEGDAQLGDWPCLGQSSVCLLIYLRPEHQET